MRHANRGQLFASGLRLIWRCRTHLTAVVLALAAGSLCSAQTAAVASPADTQAALQELQSQIRELKTMVTQLQSETASSHAEIGRLREELATEHAAASSQSVTVDEQSPAYSGD